MIEVARRSPLDPASRELIAGSQRALLEHYPPEECFSLSPEELDDPATEFFVATLEGRAAGCVALVDKGGYGEIKRMFVTPEARGRRIAHHLLDALEAAARARGLDRLKLETGHVLAAAHRVYRARGYADCPAFGGYPDLEGNLFMEKSLTVEA